MKNYTKTLVLILLIPLLMDSCKCNKGKTTTVCPDCTVQGQVCVDGMCKCPESDQEVVGNACQFIDRSDPGMYYWTSLNTNGNCYDSVMAKWYLDSNIIGNTGLISGSIFMSFEFLGRSDTYTSCHASDTRVKIKDSIMYLECVFVDLRNMLEAVDCFDLDERVDGMRVEARLNKTMDTMWAHFTFNEFTNMLHSNYGEFDQVFVRYW